jgi:polyhydroxybutyrate depolymerase
MKYAALLLLALLCLGLQSCLDHDGNGLVCQGVEDCADGIPLTTGLQTFESVGQEREFYVQVPADHYSSDTPMPVVFAFHGATGTYDQWVSGYYDLAAAIGDEAILVYPQALVGSAGITQWDFDYDLDYFDDVLNFIKRRMHVDRNRIFAAGHSNGGGMAHELGCKRGDVVRAIAPHAGILKGSVCTGSVAVFQTHSANDGLVNWGTGEAGHQFWVDYNGFEYDVSMPGTAPSCIDHSMGGSPYPVEWCLHQEGMGDSGHDWPSFASEATWQFFSNLPTAEPTSEPPAGGGNSAIQFDATIAFTIRLPASATGVINYAALSFYDAGTQPPVGTGPNTILLGSFDPGNLTPGSERSYQFPISYVSETFPGTYAFSVIIYFDGGGPIPLGGRDYMVFYDVDLIDRNLAVTIDEVLELAVLP